MQPPPVVPELYTDALQGDPDVEVATGVWTEKLSPSASCKLKTFFSPCCCNHIHSLHASSREEALGKDKGMWGEGLILKEKCRIEKRGWQLNYIQYASYALGTHVWQFKDFKGSIPPNVFVSLDFCLWAVCAEWNKYLKTLLLFFFFKESRLYKGGGKWLEKSAKLQHTYQEVHITESPQKTAKVILSADKECNYT